MSTKLGAWGVPQTYGSVWNNDFICIGEVWKNIEEVWICIGGAWYASYDRNIDISSTWKT